MKPPHPLLTAIPRGPSFDDLAGDTLKAWADKAKELLAGPPKLRPKAVLLAGLPGTGKGACTRALARHLDLPVWHFDAATDATHLGEVLEVVRESDPSVLWIDGLNSRCHMLARWITLHDVIPGIVAATTDEPHRLPPAMLRAGVFDDVFHLDLPDGSARAFIWDAVLKRFGIGPAGIDNVLLAQATGMYTPAEIVACVKRAVAAGATDERSLLEPVGAICPVGIECDEQLALLRDWARTRHVPAA